VLLVLKEQPAQVQQVLTVLLAYKVLLDPMAQLALKVRLVIPAIKVQQALQVQTAQQVLLVLKEILEILAELQVYRELLVLLV
jgi:hypothetical protein